MPLPLSEDEVRHVAKLSRLELDDDEIRRFTHQLADILNYIAKLDELNVDNIEPMAHPCDVTNVQREDRTHAGMSVEQVLANAPEKSPPFFKVPKVLGNDSGACPPPVPA